MMTSVSLDLGGTNVKAALVENGSVADSFSAPSRPGDGIAATLHSVEDVVSKWLKEAAVGGVGIAFPGLVDPVNKRVITRGGKYSDAWQFDFEGWAREKFALPIALDNDALAAAVGEHAYGAAKGTDDFVLLILGTGIGAGAFMNGRPVRGKHFQAGVTMGHLPRGGVRSCTCCGSEGCSESCASTWALPALIAESGLDSPLKKEINPGFKTLRSYYDAGDALAAEIFDKCAAVWVDVIVSLVYAYDPELVVLSGGVLKWGDGLSDRLRDGVLAKAWCEWGDLRFAKAADPDASVLLGMHELINNEMPDSGVNRAFRSMN